MNLIFIGKNSVDTSVISKVVAKKDWEIHYLPFSFENSDAHEEENPELPANLTILDIQSLGDDLLKDIETIGQPEPITVVVLYNSSSLRLYDLYKGFDFNKFLSIGYDTGNEPNGDYDSEQDRMRKITPREREVLGLICNELTNRDIAEKLDISIRTVDAHRRNLLLKTGADNTAGLVTYAVKAGICEL